MYKKNHFCTEIPPRLCQQKVWSWWVSTLKKLNVRFPRLLGQKTLRHPVGDLAPAWR